MADRPTLALDLATIFGWALMAPGQRAVADSVRLVGTRRPQRFRALEEWLTEKAGEVGGFAEVAHFERGGFRSELARKLHYGFSAKVEEWCWDTDTPYRTEHESTVRKLMLGRGVFPKGESKAAVDRWVRAQGYEPRTHDSSDAIVLAHFCLKVPRA
jgi:hypothetical protein